MKGLWLGTLTGTKAKSVSLRKVWTSSTSGASGQNSKAASAAARKGKNAMPAAETTIPELMADVDDNLRRFDYPADLREEVVRKFVAALLYASDHPDWAWCYFYREFGRMTIRQTAQLRNISQSNVKRLLDIRVPTEIYDLLPPEPRAKGE